MCSDIIDTGDGFGFEGAGPAPEQVVTVSLLNAESDSARLFAEADFRRSEGSLSGAVAVEQMVRNVVVSAASSLPQRSAALNVAIHSDCPYVQPALAKVLGEIFAEDPTRSGDIVTVVAVTDAGVRREFSSTELFSGPEILDDITSIEALMRRPGISVVYLYQSNYCDTNAEAECDVCVHASAAHMDFSDVGLFEIPLESVADMDKARVETLQAQGLLIDQPTIQIIADGQVIYSIQGPGLKSPYRLIKASLESQGATPYQYN
ncbi:MAG: hypothetical protein H6619_02645 [Deltaproteobacteria bacterium]|nr:hypothetical protein [Deltaproteobacteria bacterium]